MQNVSIVCISMQRPTTRICICSHRVMHADGSLAKWSALHPRIESIARSTSCLPLAG